MKVITISREYGAGGHSVGKAVAKKLGIEIYDQDIIKETAEKSGVDREELKEEGKLTLGDVFLRNITPVSYDLKNTIFEYQSEVIVNFAKQGPCVILGRCADAVLKEAGIESLDVFLYASEEARIKRVGELIGTDDEAKIRKAIKHIDHERSAYYNYFTTEHWGYYKNYNLMLDTGLLGYDTCVDIICEAAKKA